LRSAINDAPIPAKIAQNADVISKTEKGVAATARAASAPNRSFPPNAVSKALCRDQRMARPARVTTKVLGRTASNDVNVPAPKAREMVKVAAITLA
jgi:hypothetical protein